MNKSSMRHVHLFRKSGYDHKLVYTPCDKKNRKNKNRSRNITYFNPPYSQNVQTNIGEKFLKLIDKHFPPTHILAKIVNRNNVKLSYRCMPNLKKAISRHNHKVKEGEQVQAEPGCNCSGRLGPCPLQGGCLVDKVVYRAEVKQENGTVNTYTGMTGNRFKDRFYKHNDTIEDEHHNNHTTLSHHIWDLKRKKLNFEPKWKIIDRGNVFDPTTRKCRLCLKEKYYIIFQPPGATLNERSELFSTCRHRLSQTLQKTK